MSSPSVVRLANADDFVEVWALMRMSYAENAVFPLARRKAQECVKRALRYEHGAIGVIGSKEGVLEGLAFLCIGTFWYSEAPHLEEYMVYVQPDHRKSGHAKALLDWMEKQVNETGLPLMTGVFSNSARNEAKCRLYSRKFPKLGEFFYLQPKNSTMMPALVASSS
jgi:GNAT superfamily N-acetyltransferase